MRDRAAADLVLVLCEAGDAAAYWIRDGLEARGLAALAVTSIELCAATWDHRIGRDGASVQITLPGGPAIDGERVRGVVNRLVAVPGAFLSSFDEADRVYVEQEMRALLCSALETLRARGVPVVEPAHPYGLGGRWRSPAEWALLAAAAGFDVPAWRWDDAAGEGPAAHPGVTAIVVGDEAIGLPSDDQQAAVACFGLARLAGSRLLGVSVERGPDGLRFGGATTVPDLRIAGGAGLDALAGLLW